MNDSNMVSHARYELDLIDEEADVAAAYIAIVEIFAAMGHSGGSAEVGVEVVNQLLKQQNLSPLTNNPEEWQHHDEKVWGEIGGVWQNKRLGEAFSNDGGKTYYLLSEGGRRHGEKRYHRSKTYLKATG